MNFINKLKPFYLYFMLYAILGWIYEVVLEVLGWMYEVVLEEFIYKWGVF